MLRRILFTSELSLFVLIHFGLIQITLGNGGLLGFKATFSQKFYSDFCRERERERGERKRERERKREKRQVEKLTLWSFQTQGIESESNGFQTRYIFEYSSILFHFLKKYFLNRINFMVQKILSLKLCLSLPLSLTPFSLSLTPFFLSFLRFFSQSIIHHRLVRMHGNTLRKCQTTFDTSVTFDTLDMKVSTN